MAGIGVPGWIRERLRQAGDHGPTEGLEIAAEFLDLARPYVAGVNIIVPSGRYEPVINLVQAVRREPEGVRGNGRAITPASSGPDSEEASFSRLRTENSRLGRS
jgi:hypothetical protein